MSDPIENPNCPLCGTKLVPARNVKTHVNSWICPVAECHETDVVALKEQESKA